tara:strand:- start:549 stop:800 length:252 start_codon:yes stop_codon:yes gene_type:complete
MSYDITEKREDLHLLDSVETNTILDAAEFYMESTYAMMDCTPARCINEEDFEFEVLEIEQKEKIITVSKYDVEAMAKHFGLIK